MIDIAGDDGFELYHKIRELDNRVKICFLTAGEMHCEEIRNEAFPGLDTNCFIRNL
jgi:two-component SAPR family response regulator